VNIYTKKANIGHLVKVQPGAPRAPASHKGENIVQESMATEASLQLSFHGHVVFSSSGKWLHPLFQLERFLHTHRIDMGSAAIRDKVVGRGSAFLIARLGIRKVHAVLLSRLGKDVFDREGVACTWDTLVDQIQCRTEKLLREVTSPEEAHGILAELARES
jgi:hypothetical protein